MADELNLSIGDPSVADESEGRRRRRRERTTASNSSSTASEKREDAEVLSRLGRVLDRIATNREAKGDDELAEAIREDGEAMAQGIMSLTSNFRPLRSPLLMVLNLIEPLLAFGRIGRILLGRFVRWRYRRAEARAETEAEEQFEVPVA